MILPVDRVVSHVMSGCFDVDYLDRALCFRRVYIPFNIYSFPVFGLFVVLRAATVVRLCLRVNAYHAP